MQVHSASILIRVSIVKIAWECFLPLTEKQGLAYKTVFYLKSWLNKWE